MQEPEDYKRQKKSPRKNGGLNVRVPPQYFSGTSRNRISPSCAVLATSTPSRL